MMFFTGGGSAEAVDLFNQLGVPYEPVDVLTEPEVRDGIRKMAPGAEIPQIYIAGKRIGGTAELTELDRRGELQPLLREAS